MRRFYIRGLIEEKMGVENRLEGGRRGFRPGGGDRREWEKAERLAAARAELVENTPPIDYAAAFDSLDIMEKVMRRFYIRGLIEEKMGIETDWKAADAAFVQAVAIAENEPGRGVPFRWPVLRVTVRQS
jgi:hypothetical protein